MRTESTRAPKTKLTNLTIALAALSVVGFVAGCRSAQSQQGDIAVNAPATGVVRSVLVADGAAIEKDAVIVEIAVPSEQAGAQPDNQQKDRDTQQARAAVARSDVVAAEADANRTLVELQRVEPLVKRGLASQAELDRARAQTQDAQARLERAREQEKTAERQRSATQQPGGLIGAPKEEIIAIRAPAAGKIHQINVQAGQQVTIGETLARVSSGS